MVAQTVWEPRSCTAVRVWLQTGGVRYLAVSPAVAVPVPAGQRLGGADLQRAAQHVPAAQNQVRIREIRFLN